MKRIKIRAMLLGLSLCICDAAGCQSLNASEKRLQRVMTNLLADRGMRLTRTQTNSQQSEKYLYYESADGYASADAKAYSCHVTFTALSARLQSGPRRADNRPYASVGAVLQRYLPAMRVVLGTSALDTNRAKGQLDTLQPDGSYLYGRTSVMFRIKVNGYGFVDRLYGANLGVDQVTGKVLYYGDQLKRPAVTTPDVRLTESQARNKASTELHVPGTSLQYLGLGYAANDGESAVVCYRYRYEGTG